MYSGCSVQLLSYSLSGPEYIYSEPVQLLYTVQYEPEYICYFRYCNWNWNCTTEDCVTGLDTVYWVTGTCNADWSWLLVQWQHFHHVDYAAGRVYMSCSIQYQLQSSVQYSVYSYSAKGGSGSAVARVAYVLRTQLQYPEYICYCCYWNCILSVLSTYATYATVPVTVAPVAYVLRFIQFSYSSRRSIYSSVTQSTYATVTGLHETEYICYFATVTEYCGPEYICSFATGTE